MCDFKENCLNYQKEDCPHLKFNERPDCFKDGGKSHQTDAACVSTEFAGSVTVESEAHIIMTEDEYSELKIIGWHKVCKNIDSAGNIGVQYLGETK